MNYRGQQIEFILRDNDGTKLEHIKGNISKALPELLAVLEYRLNSKVLKSDISIKLDRFISEFKADCKKISDKVKNE